MPRKRSILVLLIGALGIGLLCQFLLRGSTTERVGLMHQTDTETHKDEPALPAHVESEQDAQGRDESTRRDLPSSGAAPESAGASCVTFSYSNGTPAAGLGVCRATALSMYKIEVAAGPAVWDEHLDDHGRLAEDVVRRLGPLIDVRLSSCSLQVMRLDPAPGQRYVLPDLTAQVFRLPVAPPGVNAQFLVEGRDLVKCGSSVEYAQEIKGTEFADRFRVTAVDSVHGTLVLACARGELSSDKPSTSMPLPAGTYAITPLTCSVGWWFDDFSADARGGPIDILLHQVPVTTVILPTELDGRARQPTDARVLIASHDPAFGESSGEISLPWRVEGDRILVSQRYRDTGDERFVTYALKIYWSDGTDSTTQPGSWDSLLGTVGFDK